MASGGSGVKTDALAGSGTATSNAAGLYSPLTSSYAALASGTDGLSPQQKTNALTASGQSLGGSAAAITGQGALEQARTGNVGSYAAIADAAMRGGGAQESANALGVQNQSDEIARQNQRVGLAGETGLYDTNSQDALSYLNVANNAAKPFWQTALLQGISSAGQAAGAYAGK